MPRLAAAALIALLATKSSGALRAMWLSAPIGVRGRSVARGLVRCYAASHPNVRLAPADHPLTTRQAAENA
jgi:hypothetical protein